MPVIKLVSPSTTDSLNNSGLIAVSAEIISAAPLISFTIFNNGEIAATETTTKPKRTENNKYTIGCLVSLQAGLNTIYIEASNNLGISISDKRFITCQQQPFVIWVSPVLSNLTVESDSTEIKAEIKTELDIKNVVLNINGSESKYGTEVIKRKNNNTYSFDKSIHLSPGKNIIYISAENMKGKSRSATRIINFGSPPSITLISPLPADSLNNSGIIKVSAEIVSAFPIMSFIVYNNHEKVATQATTKPVQKGNNRYLIGCLVSLQAGLNAIYIEANNNLGISISDKRFITCQQQPFVIWVSPVLSNLTFESDSTEIKAEIKTELDIKNVVLNINGSEFKYGTEVIKRKNNNTYNFDKSIHLSPGKNIIYISAENMKGKSRSATRIINFGSPPSITLISPLPADSLNNSGIIKVSAEIVSATPIMSFVVYNNHENVATQATTKPVQKGNNKYILDCLVSLQAGLNTIYIEANNNLGISISDKRFITCQQQPFVIWISPEAINSFTKSDLLKIKAEIKTDIDLQNVTINLNGMEQVCEKALIIRQTNNTYIVEKLIQFNRDKNSIYIAANNLKGTTKSSVRYINITGSMPAITLITPSLIDSLNNSGIAVVSAEIKSNTALQAVRIYNNKVMVVGENVINPEQKDSVTYTIKAFMPLLTGKNIFYIEAINTNGTSASEKRTLTCHLEPIVRWISPSTGSSTTGSDKMKIKAEIKTSFDLLSTGIILNDNVLTPEKGEITRVNNDTYVLERNISLNTGKNNIVLKADNAKGSGFSSSCNIKYLAEIVSEINWLLPADANSVTYKTELSISAAIKTKSKINNTILSLNGIELVPGNSIKISKKAPNDFLYENSIALNPGTNTLELSAVTDEGAISSEKRLITYQVPILPALSWQDPVSEKAEVNKPILDIRVTIRSIVKLDKIKVYVNGKALNNIGLSDIIKKENENFVLENTVELQPGDNTIYITADNMAGTAKSVIRNVRYVIPTVPVITWRNPVESVSGILEGTITLRAGITSTTVLQNIEAYLNDKLLSGISASDAVNERQGEYKIEKSITLRQGENRIYIVAANDAGRTNSETRSVNYTTPAAPVVNWISPSNPATNINLNSARIKAKVQSSGKLQSLLVYVNGIASEEVSQITPSGSQGEYIVEKSISLQPGENVIYMVATNNFGTIKSDLRSLTNPPTNPPIISWTSPLNTSAIVNSETVVIEACIKSATDLKSAQIFVNGVPQQSVMTFQASNQQGDCNYRLAKPIILKEGDNSVIIIATNFAGSTNSDRRLIRYLATSMVEKRLALIIGNADYSSGALKNPVNDANLIEGTLKTLGFEVIKRINATKNVMFEAVRDFSKRLPDYNVALFYYAGHGIQIDGQNYLIPTDAALKDKTDCKWEAVRVNDIVEEFEKVPDNVNIVILDACRNNPFRSWVRGGEQGFRALPAVSGTIVSFATSEGSVAADGSGSNGTYTEELVKQLVIPQSISSVFINTRKQVLFRTNNMQRPQDWNMLTGEFYFKK